MFTDGDILMAIPELYRYGREGSYFGMKMFSWYMLDAVLQVSTRTSPRRMVLNQSTVCHHLLPHHLLLRPDYSETRRLWDRDVRVLGHHGPIHCPCC